MASSISPGIFPYLGGSTSTGQLRSAVVSCGGAVVSGKQGAKLAKEVPGVLVDPATYAPQGKNAAEGLFDYDDWLMRQQAAGVPVILTDTPRIPNKDRSALHEALTRWDRLDKPTVVVLPSCRCFCCAATFPPSGRSPMERLQVSSGGRQVAGTDRFPCAHLRTMTSGTNPRRC
jgi:hypothetical protein